jgi:hypothetical protein
MNQISILIKTSFGEIQIIGDSKSEILDALEDLNQEFIAELNEKISRLIETQAKDDLKGIIDIGRDGPVIVSKKRLTHYEAIGLILYCMRDQQGSSRQISKRLTASGKKVTVPARLHEMRKRGHVFKPVERAPYYKLSTKGVKWIEEELIPSIKKN